MPFRPLTVTALGGSHLCDTLAKALAHAVPWRELWAGLAPDWDGPIIMESLDSGRLLDDAREMRHAPDLAHEIAEEAGLLGKHVFVLYWPGEEGIERWVEHLCEIGAQYGLECEPLEASPRETQSIISELTMRRELGMWLRWPVERVRPRPVYPIILDLPRSPLFVGSYLRVGVRIDPASGLTWSDLKFSVPDGPHAGQISPSHDREFDPHRPHIMLLVGYRPGQYVIEATSVATGNLVGRGDFTVTSLWTDDINGPSQWITGVVPQQFVMGATWGGGPAGPQNINVMPAAGTRGLAMILVDTSTQRYSSTASVQQALRNTWMDEAVNGVNVAGSAVPASTHGYYQEVSFGAYGVSAQIVGPLSLSGSFDDYFAQDPVSGIWVPKNGYAQACITAADSQLNYNDFQTIVFIGRGVDADPANGITARYPWPCAWGGTFGTAEGNQSLGVISMPFNWATKPIRATLAHEIGHNLGLPDEYKPVVNEPHPPPSARNPGSWELMHNEIPLPHMTLVNRMALGWVNASWIKTFNFAQSAVPLQQEVLLSPVELGQPPAGQFIGIEIRIADGRNYYCEYRVSQATQMGDQNLPTNNRVLTTDMASDPSQEPMNRPRILLLMNDPDGDGAVLDTGDDYVEPDPSAPGLELKIEAVDINGTRAKVRINYGVNGRPDPSIRPWPAAPDRRWQSPDIEIVNARNQTDPSWKNVPWEGHNNTIIAQITNSGNVDAPSVRANFGVKDYTVGGTPETILGYDIHDVARGATVPFSVNWPVPSQGHYCVTVRIPLYQVPTALNVVELTELNNMAQSNYDRFISRTASPPTREMTRVVVGNPFQEKLRVVISPAQTNPLYRTFVEHRWLELNPGEARSVLVMSEYAPDGRPPTAPDVEELYYIPNDIGIVAAMWDPRHKVSDGITLFGGAQIQVVTGRNTEMVDVAYDQEEMLYGRILAVDEERAQPVPGGSVVVTIGDDEGERYATAAVEADGMFYAHVGRRWRTLQAYYTGLAGYADCEGRVIQH